MLVHHHLLLEDGGGSDGGGALKIAALQSRGSPVDRRGLEKRDNVTGQALRGFPVQKAENIYVIDKVGKSRDLDDLLEKTRI